MICILSTLLLKFAKELAGTLIDTSLIPTAGKNASLMEFVKTLKSDKRIEGEKAKNIESIIRSGDEGSLEVIVVKLLDELIPKRRPGEYMCKICEVAKKGHDCPYCKFCSTPAEKYEKNGHTCHICSICFDKAKRKKKCEQLPIGNCKCENEQT